MKDLIILTLCIISLIGLYKSMQVKQTFDRATVIEMMQYPQHQQDNVVERYTRNMSDEELTEILGL